MIFAKIYHDKSAPAGGFTHTTFTEDFDHSSLFSFSPCVVFSGFFSSKERLKERKTDTEELIGRTQSNTSPTKPRDTRLMEDLQPISLTSPPLVTAVGHLQACLLVKDIQ